MVPVVGGLADEQPEQVFNNVVPKINKGIVYRGGYRVEWISSRMEGFRGPPACGETGSRWKWITHLVKVAASSFSLLAEWRAEFS